MWRGVLFLACLGTVRLSFADGVQYSRPEFSFLPGSVIYVFDVPTPNSEEARKVCLGLFRHPGSDLTYGTCVPAKEKVCNRVEDFGQNFTSLIIPAASEKTGEITTSEDEQDLVIVDGRRWRRAGYHNAIFRQVGTDKVEKPIYGNVCSIRIEPADLFREPGAPYKFLFCKSVKPIRAQRKDKFGKPKFKDDGSPSIGDTVVCPTAEKCASPEWAIKPVMKIYPDEEEEAGTPHAAGARSQSQVPHESEKTGKTSNRER